MQRSMNFLLRGSAKIRLVTAQEGHAVIEQIESINDRKTSPAVVRIAPENGKLLTVFGIHLLGRANRFSDPNRWLRTVKQHSDIDVAINCAKAPMRKAAELIN